MTETTYSNASTRELPLAPGGEVHVHLTSNDARIRGTDRDVVTVRAPGGEDLDDEIIITEDGDRVSIRNAETGVSFGNLRIGTQGSADLDIEVPRSARLTFKTLSGDVIAEGIGRGSRWSTSSGDLRLVVGGGSVTADSMSGDLTIEATDAVGIRVRSVSGDVRLSAPRLDALQLSSTSGDVRIAGELGSDFEHTISSVSGDVYVDSSSPIRLESQTIAGDVRATGAHRAEGGRGRRTIVVGDGSVRLAVRTTSGDIRLRGGDSIDGDVLPPLAPVPPVAPVAPVAPIAPVPPVPPVAPVPPVPPVQPLPEAWVVAEAEAAPNLVRRADASVEEPSLAPPEGSPTQGGESSVDRREEARLDILRALERGELDVAAASHRLEQLDEAGPRFFRGFC
jgi:hypothetical protein